MNQPKMTYKNFTLKIKREDFSNFEKCEELKLLCQDFFLSMNSFTEHNFTGAIKIEFPEIIKGAINVSPDGFAYLIMLMLSEVAGNSLINVDVQEVSDFIKITISDFDLVTNRETILELATNSGFFIAEADKSLVLTAKIESADELDVFNTGSLVLINYLYEAFYKCFE